MASVDVIGASVAKEREQACGYAAGMWLIQLDDADSVGSYENIIDERIPKYTDVDAIDLDTNTADTTPFWEPGEADFQEVWDMDNPVRKLFMRRKTLTFATPGSSGLRFQPAESPFEPQWHAADSFQIKLNRRIRVRRPSVVVVAFASPGYDDTTTSRVALTEGEWGDIQYVEQTLERSLMDQLGKTEAGAETPYVEATDTLRKHLAPDVFEETAGAYTTEAYNVFTTLHFEHTVPGSMEFTKVDLTP